METAYPHLVPIVVTVSVSNVLPSGAAFGVRLDDGTSCYIPVGVANIVRPRLGDDFTAKLVPNRFTRVENPTPWLAVHLSRTTVVGGPVQPVQYAMPFEVPEDTADLPSIEERVRQVMKDGGVWTDRTMYDHLFPGAAQGPGAVNFLAVRSAMQSMFGAGECAKFAMWHRVGQGQPSRIWYTCHPDRADVDEWEDV
jgi:hypothetical protein